MRGALKCITRVSWEYVDGSSSYADFEEREHAIKWSARFIDHPVRVWIDDDQVQQGFRRSSEDWGE